MATTSKVFKVDHSKSCYSLKLSYINFKGLCCNFGGYGSFLESHSPDILTFNKTHRTNQSTRLKRIL